MEQLTERIAGVSLPAILVLLTLLTAARGAFHARRSPALRAVADLFESLILAISLVFLLLRPFVVQSFFIPSGSMHPTLWEGDHILVNKCVYRLSRPTWNDIVVFRAPPEAAADEREFIKRVVGLPGDIIEVQPGYVTVGLTTYPHDAIRSYLGNPSSPGEQTDDPASPPPLRLTREALWLGANKVTAEEFARVVGKPGQRVFISPGRVLRNGVMLMECFVAEDPHYEMPPRRVPPHCLFVMGDNRNNSDDSHRWGMLQDNRIIGRADAVFWPLAHAKRLEPN